MKLKKCSVEGEIEKANVRPVVYASLVAIVFSLPAMVSVKIPTHGVILDITGAEWFMILWVTLGPLIFSRRNTPQRWWCYFGLMAFLLTRFTLWSYIFTEYHSGRRPWMPSRMSFALLKFSLFLAYFSLAPVAVSWCRLRYLPRS